MAKRKPKHSNGEIIWRMTYSLNLTGDIARAEPVVLLLADKRGWQYLASAFAKMAKRKITKELVACGDPDDHCHIGVDYSPVNKSLSHRFEFRLGILSPESRNQTLKKYQLNKSGAKGDLQRIFGALIDSADRSVKESNKLIRRIESEPEAFDDQYENMFGVTLSTGLPTKKKKGKK